jgi:hypothetical protein
VAITIFHVSKLTLQTAGFHDQATEMIAGKWLHFWSEIGVVLFAIGLFKAYLSMLFDFASFLCLRWKLPTIMAPFRVSMQLFFITT